MKQDKKVDLQLLWVLVCCYFIERVGIGMLSPPACNDASASLLHGEVALVCHHCMKGWVFTCRVGVALMCRCCMVGIGMCGLQTLKNERKKRKL